MRVVETKVYTYAELSPKAQERARDWYISLSDSSDLDIVADEWKRDVLPALGFSAVEALWSGFASQGDGAYFAGTWRARDCNPAAMLADRPTDETLHSLAERLLRIACAHRDMFASLRHTGRYYHEYSVSYDVETETPIESDQEYIALETEFIEVCRALMCHLYLRLDDMNDAIREDDYVAECLSGGCYEFTEEGEHYA